MARVFVYLNNEKSLVFYNVENLIFGLNPDQRFITIRSGSKIDYINTKYIKRISYYDEGGENSNSDLKDV